MRFIPRSARQALIAGTAVLVLAGTAVGIAAAQTQPTPTPTAGQQARQNAYQAFLDALAKRLNTSTANLETAISQARGDAGLPAGNGFPGPGRRPGPGGPGAPVGPGGAGRPGFAFGPRGFDLNAAATAIGITPDQLRTEIRGKSLAQVAEAHQKSATDVATALKNAAHTRVDQAVANNRLTADQGTQAKTRIDQGIDQLMQRVVPQAGDGPRRPGPGGPGGPGRRGASDEVGA